MSLIHRYIKRAIDEALRDRYHTLMDTKEAGAKGGRNRWKKIGKKQRSEIMKKVRAGAKRPTIYINK